jgi:hypothetical protein
MDFQRLALPAVIWVLVMGLVLLVSRDWRPTLLALAGQYIGVFILVALSWSMELAVIKLVTGWMAGAVLGMTRLEVTTEQERTTPWLAGRLFRLLAAAVFLLAAFSAAPQLAEWSPRLSLYQAMGGLVLLSLGLLHMGLTTRSWRLVLGLLTSLAGFEIIYAAVEDAYLVAGLLAVINLAVALVGAYLLAEVTHAGEER